MFFSVGRRSQSPPHACSHMLVLPSRVPLNGWCLERNSAVNQSEYAKVGKRLLHPRIIFLCRSYLRKDGVPPPPGKPTQQPPSHAYTLREIPNYAGTAPLNTVESKYHYVASFVLGIKTSFSIKFTSFDVFFLFETERTFTRPLSKKMVNMRKLTPSNLTFNSAFDIFEFDSVIKYSFTFYV